MVALYDEVVRIFYDRERNLFLDEGGFIIHEHILLRMITSNDIFLFKHKKEWMIVPHRTVHRMCVEMDYPDEDCYPCELRRTP